MGQDLRFRRLPCVAGRGSMVLAALLLAACGGGGGGGSDTPTCTALVFDRALASPAPGDVYLDRAGSTCSTVNVSVLVNNLTGIYTVGFDLNYPAGLLSYDSYVLGPLMQKGSPMNPVQVIFSDSPGVLHVSVSRFGADPPVDASGSEALITFRFSRIAAGSGGIDFDVSGGSSITEAVIDEKSNPRPATFAPGHGGMVTVP